MKTKELKSTLRCKAKKFAACTMATVMAVSVLLSGTSVSSASVDGASDSTVGDEGNEMQESQNEVLNSLYLANEDKNGNGWTYSSSDHTLKIIDDVTIEGNLYYGIKSDGNLHISVASGKTLTVRNYASVGKALYGIYAEGDVTLDGDGSLEIAVASTGGNIGLYSGKGIKISDIHLSVDCYTNYQTIRANGGVLVIDNAIVTATGGPCVTGNDSNRYPVQILGSSIVNIKSEGVSDSSIAGLRGREFVFSKKAHIKVSAKMRVIGDKTAQIVLSEGQTTDYYWRTDASASFTDGAHSSCSMGTYLNAKFFEYIGKDHVDHNPQSDNNGKTHSMHCLCTQEPTAMPDNCSGGTPTCMAQAICEVCKQPYGSKTEHNFVYHVCSVCGKVDDEAFIEAIVTAGSEKRGYTGFDFWEAFAFAGEHPGAVLTILQNEWPTDITVNKSEADFIIDLNGKNSGVMTLTVLQGKVTIKDSQGGGQLYTITVDNTGCVNLESGIQNDIIDLKNGTLNVNGGKAGTIWFYNGQMNWNSSSATVENKIYWRHTGDSKITMNATPDQTLNISLQVGQDLTKPLAVAGSGIRLTSDMFSIGMEAREIMYTLKPEIQDNKLYARFPLNQTNGVDMDLSPVSGFIYDTRVKTPSVTIQRYTEQGDYYELIKNALVEGRDYTVTYKDNINAGTATVIITGIGCYTGTVERTFTIGKATPEKSTVDLSKRVYSCRADKADSIDLTAYLPKDCGGITSAVPTIDGTVTYSNAPVVTNGVLSYKISQSEEAVNGTITVTVSTNNYEDITIQIPVETIDVHDVKLRDGSSVTLQNATLTEGEKLSTLKFNDAVFIDEEGNEVSGTLMWRTPDATYSVGTMEAEWVFRPTDAEHYIELCGVVTITVKAKPASGGGSSSGGASSGGGSSAGGGASSGMTDPKQDEEKPTDDNKPSDDNKKPSESKPEAVGTKLTKSGITYKVTSVKGKTPTVTYVKASKKAKGTVTIPKTVTIDGVKYRVTAIADKAFSGNKNATRIVIPDTIKTIGKKAFVDCSNLKVIVIKSTKLTSKNIDAKAFAGIAKDVVIQVPEKKLEAYKKLFVKKKLNKKVKLKAIKSK